LARVDDQVDVLLQFPSEGIQFRAQRNEALLTFRRTCRLPVIRQYGFEAEDIGLYVSNCKGCSRLTARLHPFNDLDPDLGLNGLEAELVSRALDANAGWVPPHCPSCGDPDPQPVSALFARYLPEVGLDLHVHLIRGGHRVTEIEYYVMNLAGEARTLPRPTDCVEFAEAVGTPLSVRAFWAALIAQNLDADDISAYPIQPGYFLGLRPFCDSDARLAAMSEPFYQWIDQQQADGGFDALAYFRDLEDEQLDIPYGESYHTWLAGYAGEIERALIDPFVFADSGHFVQVLDEMVRMYGLTAVRDSAEDTLFVRLTGGDIDVRINIGPLFFRILHEGYTFHRGIKRYFMDEIRAVSATAEMVKLVKAVLPTYSVQIHRGHYVEIKEASGHSFGIVDAIRAGTAYDPRNETEFRALLDDLAPGCAPLELTLGRPRAGHLSPVIPRKSA